MSYFWQIKIRVNGKIVNTYNYRTKKYAKSELQNLIWRGVHVFTENKKLPPQFSYSLLKKPGPIPKYPRIYDKGFH